MGKTVPLENPGADTADLKAAFRALGGVASDELVGGAAAQVDTLGVTPLSTPTGVNDDTLLEDFFARANGKAGSLPAGTFRLTKRLSIALSDTVITGVPGKTIIVGDFGYSLIRLLTMQNVRFFGITFQNDYVNATDDPGFGTVFSQGNDLTNVEFVECAWTGAQANTNAVKLNASTVSGGLANARVYRNVGFRKCTFTDIGRMPIEILNHLHDSVARYFNVFVEDCSTKNTGTFGGYGQISFSGKGTASVRRTDIDNPYDIGIEFVDTFGSEVDGIVFRNVTRPTALIGTSGGGDGGINTDLTIRNIRTEGHQVAASISIGQAADVLIDNMQVDIGGYVDVIGTVRMRVDRSTIKARGIYGVLLREGCIDNVIDRTTVDCALATAGTFLSVVRCDGAATTGNRARRSKLVRPAGGNRFTMANGSARNWMEECDYDTIVWAATPFLVTMSDAQAQLSSEQGQFPTLEFRGTLTANRIVFCDAGPDRQYIVRNFTTGGFSIDFRPRSGNAGVLVASNQSTIVALRNASLDAVRVGNLA